MMCCLWHNKDNNNNSSDRSFAVAGPRLWNTLPDDITSSPSLLVFRRKLKIHLFRQTAILPGHCIVAFAACCARWSLKFLLRPPKKIVMECNVATDTETGILPEGNQTCVNVYDVIEMCDPAAPPIMLQIRTRSLNPNPKP